MLNKRLFTPERNMLHSYRLKLLQSLVVLNSNCFICAARPSNRARIWRGEVIMVIDGGTFQNSLPPEICPEEKSVLYVN